MSEAQIDGLLEDFIQKYLVAVRPIADQAAQIALEQLRSYLAGIKLSDFDSAAAFADKLFEQVQAVYQGEWKSPAAKRAIKGATESAYRFFRTQDDASALSGEDSPLRVRFGAPDKRAVKFFGETDNWYFSKFVNNGDKQLKRFFSDEYIAKGGRTFGGLNPEQIEDFRAGLAEQLKKVSDVGIDRIVRASVARNRNWAHTYRLRENRVKLMQIVAVLDSRTSEICRYLNGKFVRVGVAAETIDRLVQLSPGDFALEMYESPEAKRFRATNDNPEEVAKYFDGKIDDDGVIDDALVKKGISTPPFHVSCRSRVKGLQRNLDRPVAPVEPEVEPDAETTERTAAEARARIIEIQAENATERRKLERDLLASESEYFRARRDSEEKAKWDAESKARKKKLEDFDEVVREQMRRTLFVKTPAKFEVHFNQFLPDDIKAVATKGIGYFRNFVGSDVLEGKTLTVIEERTGRAYQSGRSIYIHAGNTAKTVVHEIGHWLEQSDSQILDRIVEFHERRTEGETPEKLAELFPDAAYNDDELTKKDNYVHPYLGKTYSSGGKIVATEMLSSGLEWFYKDPYGLQERDPEFFDLIYEVVRIKKKK